MLDKGWGFLSEGPLQMLKDIRGGGRVEFCTLERKLKDATLDLLMGMSALAMLELPS
jgi:hypothetical protein